jgi:hypothetical protein
MTCKSPTSPAGLQAGAILRLDRNARLRVDPRPEGPTCEKQYRVKGFA